MSIMWTISRQLFQRSTSFGKSLALNRCTNAIPRHVKTDHKQHPLCCSLRSFHLTMLNRGLEEFFEDPNNLAKKTIKTGAPWSKDLLRLKSIEDLHKLWFVLLKERNMLETMQYHYIAEDEPMPSEERLEKVAESMGNLRDVLDERDYARNRLLYGRKSRVPGEFRKSGLGHVYWHEYNEHLIPKELNKDYYGDQPAEIAMFTRRLEEWHMRFHERREKKMFSRSFGLQIKWQKIRKNNPHLPRKPPQWWRDRFKTKFRYGIHAETPLTF